jgi:transposase
MMPRAYSNDLRRKVLEAYAAGKGSVRALAERFGVSKGWVEKILRQQRQNGRMERIEQRHGPRSRVTEAIEAYLCEELPKAPDRTLSEWQWVLREAHRLEMSVTQLWRVLNRMGLRLKKNRFTPPNRIPKRGAGVAGNGVTGLAQSRRSG